MSKHLYRILRAKPILRTATVVVLVSAACLMAGSGQFRINGAKNEKGKMRLEFESSSEEYVQIWVSDSLTTSRWEVLDIEWGQGGKHAWIDPSTLDGLGQRFYRVHKCPLTNPGDADGDGIDDVFELQDPELNPVDGSDAVIDYDGNGTNELTEYQEELPKLILHSISDSPDPFSPALTSLNLSARYLIRATDALTGASHSDGKNQKSFYVRQKIEILDGFGEIAGRLEEDFVIDPADITNASKYITASALMSWDGNDDQGAQAADGSYTYRIAGIFIRVNESGGGQGEGKEKEICVSDTLEGTVLLDATAPEIISYSPAHRTGTDDPRTPITVVFVDRVSGVNPESVALKVDGKDVTAEASITATNITWLPSTDLLAGRHIVAISSKDNAGNTAAGQAIFTVDIDKDGDGLPDWWEKMYLGTLSKGPGDDVDGDGLSNLKEYEKGTDPGNLDTDKDGFSDDFDNAVSRAFIEWGHADFTLGDEYVYAMPTWLRRAYKDGGEWVVTVLPGPPGPLSQAMGSSSANPIPWSEVDWENPDFDFGDVRIYISEDWVVRVFKDGDEYMVQEVLTPLTRWQADELLSLDPWLLPFILGLVDTESPGFNPSEWHVAASEPEGAGRLNIELDRAILTNDLVMKIGLVGHAGSSLYVDLLAGDYTKVATNLYGNLITGTDVIVEKSFDVPLETYPEAAIICLRRGTGEITVGETILYVDQDHDGLDESQEALLGSSDSKSDSDGDGTSDGMEVRKGTDVMNSASFLASICGTISYSGPQTGPIRVVVNLSANLWPAENLITLVAPGLYPVTNLPTLCNYWVFAFIDKNGNGSNECWEASGSYAANPLFLTDHTVGIDIALNDPPDKDGDGLPDCWELKYFKSATAGIAGRDEEPDGLTNLQEFEQNTDPFNPDTRGKRKYDGGGYMSLQVTSVETVPEGMKINIGYRDDFTNRLDIFRCSDLLKGEWKLVASNLATTGTNLITWVDTTYCNDRVRFYAAGNTADFDNDGLASGREHYLYKTDPFKSDTDGDRISDKEEIDQGTSPTENPDSDGDSLGDHWELYHFGDPSYYDSTDNPNGDSWTNLTEYLCGLNPAVEEERMGDEDGDWYPNIYETAHGTRCDLASDYPSPTITVPAAYPIGPVIQNAINAAQNDYDIVMVLPGTYGAGPEYWEAGNRNLDFKGHKILLISESGPSNTIIDCANKGRGFYFHSNEDNESVVSGFTIRGGYTNCGAGIYCVTSSPTIQNCIITNNTASDRGGGLYLLGASPTIKNCTIRENHAVTSGGGIYSCAHDFIHHWTGGSPGSGDPVFWSIGSSPVVEQCMIQKNDAPEGAGIYLTDTYPHTYLAPGDHHVGTPKISRCRITENISAGSSAVYSSMGVEALLENCAVVRNYCRGVHNVLGDLTVRNCAIADNRHTGLFGAGVYALHSTGEPGYTKVENTIVWENVPVEGQLFAPLANNLCEVDYTAYNSTEYPYQENYAVFGSGNITSDPKLCRDGHVQAGSPCVNQANAATAPSVDIDGEARPYADGVDMGCDEFVDTDNDKLADWWENEHGLNPVVYTDPNANPDDDELTNEQEYEAVTDPLTKAPDLDNDGLSGDAEVYYRTDPEDWDTDGDLFPDGWEVTYNYDPNDSASPDPNADSDSDGLSNFDEMRYGTDPKDMDKDTDGDGVSDGDEVTNCSDPADADDGGNPANCISIELSVGDHSGSHSERYGLLVGHVYHVAPTFGEVATTNYSFVRGKEYTFRVQWIDTKLSSADYDYTAKIGGLGGGVGWLYGVNFAIHDPEGVLGVHDESSYDFAQGKSGTLYIHDAPRPKVNLTGTERDPDNPAVQIPVPDDLEVDPGVFLESGATLLLIEDPATNVGTFTLSWVNPVPGRELFVDGNPSGLTVPCSGAWPKTYTVTQTGTWAPTDTVDVTLTHSDVTGQDVVRFVLLKVDIVLTNEYPDIPISPVYDDTEGKKWVIATFSEPDQINVDWDVQLLGIDNADANVKYQRGTSAEADVGWEGTAGVLYFTNGWLNTSICLNDGSNSVPQMSLASDILTISSVQQGDRIIIEEPLSGCRDEVAVVKNFTWNDLQRLGTNNLAIHSDFSGLANTIKDAIIYTVIFCLDNTDGRAQKPQLTNDCFPDSGLSSVVYTNFQATHTNLLQLDIPSARSIGIFPDDYEHWHMGLEVASLPTDITDKQNDLNNAVALPWDTFPELQSNTSSELVDLLNLAYSKTNISFVLSHTYEGGETHKPEYQDPAGQKTLKPGDPIRNIRYQFSTNAAPKLSYPGQEDDADWEKGTNEAPLEVRQVPMFINRNGKIVIIGDKIYLRVYTGMVSDALREE